jgi:hypothetical protein
MRSIATRWVGEAGAAKAVSYLAKSFFRAG